MLELAVRSSPVDYVDKSRSFSNFLALREIFSHIDPNRVYQVLDLGPAWNANIQFFSSYRCKLYIEDLYRCVHGEANFGLTADQKDLSSYLQTYPMGTRFDIVLCWDLFDYFNAEQINQLIQHLYNYMSPGAKLFSVTSSLQKIPTRPAVFKFVDSDKMIYESGSDSLMIGPGFNQNKLSRLLTGFRLVRAFRMSTGLEETLFTFQG